MTDGDEMGDWSYSTTLGSQAMEQLWERFNETSFQDSESWQRWEAGGEMAAWQARSHHNLNPPTQFHLATLKLYLDTGQS